MHPALCRDCLTPYPQGLKADHCIKCHSDRLLKHPELFQLQIAHIDCDAFFASVEKRDNPDLRDKPVLVGGDHPRSVVCTACYIARKYGPRSAMPMYKAKQLCPDAVVVWPDSKKYGVVSKQIRQIFARETDMFEPLSMDEAYLDLTDTHRKHQPEAPAICLARIAKHIETQLQLTVSVGLSHNKFLAKLASDMNKPRGFSIIGKHEAERILAPMPVSRIHGVGSVTATKMEQMGLSEIADLQALSEHDLVTRFGKFGHTLFGYVHGRDNRQIKNTRTAKSVSNETTFDGDIRDFQTLSKILQRLSFKVAERLDKANLAGQTVVLKIKSADFQTQTRNQQLSDPTLKADRIFDTASQMLKPICDGTPYRLIGVGVTDLTDAAKADPPDLFDLL